MVGNFWQYNCRSMNTNAPYTEINYNFATKLFAWGSRTQSESQVKVPGHQRGRPTVGEAGMEGGWGWAEGTNSRAVRISEWWGHPQAQLTLLPCIPFNKHEGSTYCVLGRVPGQVLEPNCSCSNPSPAPQETFFSSFIGMQLTLTWCKFKVSHVMIRMSYTMKWLRQ